MLDSVPHIRLNMIVRDETHVITRCLETVKPFIDSWVIVDTGSVDDTMEKVAAALEGIPGELHQREWRDFGHNRSEAFELAKDGADYLLFIDAEDTFETDEGFEIPELREDAYYVRMVSGGMSWKLLMLVSTGKPWYWKQKRHASILCRESFSSDVLHGASIIIGNDGARRGTMPAAEKYGRDAEAFEEQLKEDPGNARAMFYCAQSHRDAGDHGRALYWYGKRIQAAGWWEEVYQSHMQSAKLHAAIGSPWQICEDHYQAAYKLAPHRAEPLAALSQHYRGEKEYATAHLFACAARELTYPNDLLWIDDSVYQWRALDEYAVTAQRVGKLELAKEANERLLELVPESQRERIRDNLRWCIPGGKTSSPSAGVKQAG
jgi:tetratricopeptide (TPR) repeat protein